MSDPIIQNKEPEFKKEAQEQPIIPSTIHQNGGSSTARDISSDTSNSNGNSTSHQASEKDWTHSPSPLASSSTTTTTAPTTATAHSTSTSRDHASSKKRVFTNATNFESLGIKTRKTIPENFQVQSEPTFTTSELYGESIPTYHLTAEQFKYPLEFIESIKDVGNKYGAVKIIPPPDYDPCFTLDLPRLKFRAAKQSLNHPTSNFNEKIQFYKDLLAYHQSMKQPLTRLPSIDRRVLDLFKLRNSVHLKGGFELVCRKKLWAQIGRELGYTGRIMTSLSTSLKNAYQKVVHSYDLYLEGQGAKTSETANDLNKRPLEDGQQQDEEVKRVKLEEKELMVRDPVPTISNSRRVFKRSRDVLKAKGFRTNFESYTEEKQGITQVDDYTFPYYDFMFWHKGVEVLDFPFPSTEVSQLYNLDEFYETHLKYQKNLLTDEELDDEQLISRYKDLVGLKSAQFHVESARDLSSTVYGSGFPTMTEVTSEKSEAVTHPWNLNNLPLNENGLMRYLDSDNESLTKPQLDIEMIYSTQSWAAEDHFLYYANYQHIGGSKMNFFIPPSGQEKFEALLKKYIAESESTVGTGIIKSEFQEPIASDVCDTIKSQDQFSQRADTTNPSFLKLYSKKPNTVRYNSDFLISREALIENGIDFRHSIQRPGQFIIKFPRTYSSSVSLGFNINEHVNFAPLSWLDHALDGEKWLQSQGLLPCFSFFHLLTNVAEESKDSILLKKVLPYYSDLVDEQFEIRANLKATVSNLKTVNNKFDYISDDDLSMCFPTKVVVNVNDDSFNLEPNNFIKLYESGVFTNFKDVRFEMHISYSDDRLKTFQRTLSANAQTSKDWVLKFEDLLANNSKPPIRSLKALLVESERIMEVIPEAETLRVYLDDANTWIEKVQDLLSAKQKNRIRNRRGSVKEESSEITTSKPETVEELINEIPSLSFTCPEMDQLIEFANEVHQFEITARSFLVDQGHTVEEFYDMIDLGKSFGIELKSVSFLERIVNRLDWVQRAELVLKNSTILEEFEEVLDDAYKIASKDDQKLVDKVFARYKNGKYLNTKFKHFLSLPSLSINIVEMLLRESVGIPTDRQVMKDIEEIKAKHAQSVEERDQIYKVIAKNGVDMHALRDERIKRSQKPLEFNQELFDSLISKFQGDENDVRPKYSDAKDILERSRQFLPSNPSDPLDNYLRLSEDWLRRSKRLFGKTNAPFSVLRSHLTNIYEKDSYCFNLDDKYDANLKEVDHKTYCFCRRPESGTMIACEKCNEWYHCKCLKFGRGKSKNVGNYICPICDYRLEIPREYNCPKIEGLEEMVEEGAFLELVPDEMNLVRSICLDAANFRKFLKKELQWENGQIVDKDVQKLKFYLRKLEGACVLLSDEYNQLRQLAYKLDPICDVPPPIVETSNKTRKRRRPPSEASGQQSGQASMPGTTPGSPNVTIDSIPTASTTATTTTTTTTTKTATQGPSEPMDSVKRIDLLHFNNPAEPKTSAKPTNPEQLPAGVPAQTPSNQSEPEKITPNASGVTPESTSSKQGEGLGDCVN